MKSKFFSINTFGNTIIVFVVFICLFPTFRLLLFGGDESGNFLELFVSMLPEIFLLLIFLFAAYKLNAGRAEYRNAFSPYDLYFLLFIVTNTLLGIILSADAKIAIYGFRATYLAMFFYFVGRIYNIYSLSETENLLEKIFKWFFIFASIGLFVHFGMSEFEMKMIQMTGHEQTKYFVERMTSLLWTPVLFGTLMGISCLYFCFKILTTGEKKYYLFFSVVWLCLFLTVSRGPIIGFLIGFVFLSAFFFQRWKTLLVILASMIVSVSILSLILTGEFKMLGWIFTSTADTMMMSNDVSRVQRWIISFEDFKRRPWGYGLGKAGETAFRFLKDTETPAAVYTTDGWFLKMACETGIYGLFSYLFICWIYFIKGIRFVRSNAGTIITFALAVFLMINAQNIVANTLDFHPFIGIYWMIIGFSVNRMQNE